MENIIFTSAYVAGLESENSIAGEYVYSVEGDGIVCIVWHPSLFHMEVFADRDYSCISLHLDHHFAQLEFRNR